MKLSLFTFLVAAAGAMAQPAGIALPPGAVGVVVSNDLTVNFLNVNLSSVPAGYTAASGSYRGWCVDDPEALLGNPFPTAKTLLSSYDPAAAVAAPWVPWPKLNYLLNHKGSASFPDVQRAIWDLLGVSSLNPNVPPPFPATTVSSALLDDTRANGANFVPAQGGTLAVLIAQDAVIGGLQEVVLELPIPVATNQAVPPSISCGGVSTAVGAQGSAYTAQFLTTGGTAPYKFQIATGALPPNLTLNPANGILSGTPIVAGSFPITVAVTDSGAPPQFAASSVCTIKISATNTGGNFTTYTQGGWGAAPHGNNPGAVLKAYFPLVFPGVAVSIGSGSKVITFSGPLAIQNFLPQGGSPGTLASSALDPKSSAAGVFAGQLLSATLSLGFSNAGITRFGLAGLKVKSGLLAGYTVAQVIALANEAIASNYTHMPAGLTLSGLSDVLDAINNNFDNGAVNKGYLR